MSYHVLPIDDLKEHSEESTCECCPELKMANGEMIFVHNAWDKRELREQAIEKYNGDWIPINEYPLPRNGAIIVCGTMPEDIEIEDSSFKFTTIAFCDPIGLMDRFGEPYEGKQYLTHWKPLPEPI